MFSLFRRFSCVAGLLRSVQLEGISDCCTAAIIGFRVWGSGFRVQGLGVYKQKVKDDCVKAVYATAAEASLVVLPYINGQVGAVPVSCKS